MVGCWTVLLLISLFPALGVLIFYFVIGGGSFTLGFFVGLAYLPVFLVWMGCWWFFFRELGFVHISGYEVVDRLFFRASFFSGAVLWQGKNKKDLRNQ